MRKRTSNVAAAAVVAVPALLAGLWFGSCGEPETVVVERIVEVAAPELQELVESLRIERDGIRARLEAIQARPPRTVYKDTTLYVDLPAPACSDRMAMDDEGQVSAGVYDAVAGGWRRSLLEGVDLANCDEGWSWGPEGFTCNRARFGHFRLGLGASYAAPLAPGATAGMAATAGVTWRPAYRSTWRVDAVVTTRETFEISVWKGF